MEYYNFDYYFDKIKENLSFSKEEFLFLLEGNIRPDDTFFSELDFLQYVFEEIREISIKRRNELLELLQPSDYVIGILSNKIEKLKLKSKVYDLTVRLAKLILDSSSFFKNKEEMIKEIDTLLKELKQINIEVGEIYSKLLPLISSEEEKEQYNKFFG